MKPLLVRSIPFLQSTLVNAIRGTKARPKFRSYHAITSHSKPSYIDSLPHTMPKDGDPMLFMKIPICLLLFMIVVTISIAEPSELFLFLSGEELGYLESSGCEDDIGGLAKRATPLQSLKQQYPASLNIHTGNIYW